MASAPLGSFSFRGSNFTLLQSATYRLCPGRPLTAKFACGSRSTQRMPSRHAANTLLCSTETPFRMELPPLDAPANELSAITIANERKQRLEIRTMGTLSKRPRLSLLSDECKPTRIRSMKLLLTVGYENTAFFRRLFKRCTGCFVQSPVAAERVEIIIVTDPSSPGRVGAGTAI
jgi:hypothetical protein